MADAPVSQNLSNRQYVRTPASFECATCGKTVTRADKPSMILGAFLRLRYCSRPCSWASFKGDPDALFWQKVAKGADGECWVWTGSKVRTGYGVHWADGKHVKAHRYSYALHYGEIPEGMSVLHSCDNPTCCNPAHLRLGTQKDNMADMVARNRRVAITGERHPSARLTAQDVAYIRQRLEPAHKTAAMFGVSRSLVAKIRQGALWRAA